MELTLTQQTSDGAVPSHILRMCNIAFEEDLEPLWRDFDRMVHSLGVLDVTIVSHAMWVRHDLRPEGFERLRTAYVEGVATAPDHRNRGYATRVLNDLMEHLPGDIELAALCPAEPGLYLKSGWQFWRGPLRVEMPSGEVVDTPDERIMIKTLPRTPELDLEGALVARWRPGEVW